MTTKYENIHIQSTLTNSVVSAPQRGPWGDARFRGNCDGTLVRDLILRYGPKRVADPMLGSGTVRDVVDQLNRQGHDIKFWGSDLSQGFDLRRDPFPGPFDFIWVHPPYWNMIVYSNDPRDLSNCSDYFDFRRALEQCLVRCFDALGSGGRLAVLVGDLRRKGRYIPIVRDVLNMEGQLGQLRSVVIKTQHNCTSDGREYRQLEDPRIAHEYCVIFKAI